MTIKQQKAIQSIIKSSTGKWPNEFSSIKLIDSKTQKTIMNPDNYAITHNSLSFEKANKLVAAIFKKDFYIDTENNILEVFN